MWPRDRKAQNKELTHPRLPKLPTSTLDATIEDIGMGGVVESSFKVVENTRCSNKCG